MNRKEIINRAKIALKVKTDQQLSEILGLGSGAVACWKKRNTIDLELLLEKCGRNIDLNWLIWGDGLGHNDPPKENATDVCKSGETDNLLDVLRQQNEFLIKQIEMKDKMIEKLMNI